jgi:Peptidase family M28
MKKSAFLTLLSILFTILISIYQLQPPAAAYTNTPVTEFSSQRAIKHLEVIAQQPHPIGSLEQTKVGNYIFQALTSLGIKTEIQTATVVNPRGEVPFSAGSVRNIVGKLDGTDSTKSILLVAHYDSVKNGPGASDNGAGVAGLIETAKALKVSSPLKNNAIFLFTDGEEVGFLGAKAFIDEYPWAKEVGLVLNFEARGNSGPSVMFETSDNNGWLIPEFAASVKHPVATSLTCSIYKLLPNDTDLTVFKEAGLAGLNFAYLQGVVYYHTLSDNLKNINERSLQHHGDYALALTRHFGNLNLEKTQKSDAIYFDILGKFVIHYPEKWRYSLTTVVLILFVAVVTLGLRKKLLKFSGITFGFFAFLLNIISAFGIVTFVWWILENLYGYKSIPQGDTYNSNFYIISFIALATAITSVLYIWFRKKVSVLNLTIGALFWWLILMVLTTLYLPGASYLFTWSLLFSLFGLGIIFAARPHKYLLEKKFVLLSICAIPGIVLFAPTIYLLFMALTLKLSGVVIIWVVFFLGLLVPHFYLITATKKWLLPTVSLLISLAFIALGSYTSDFNVNHPKPNSIFYGLNADNQTAIWASVDERPDEWTSQFLGANTRKTTLPEYLPTIPRKFLRNQAPVINLLTPTIEILSDKNLNGTKSIQMRIKSPRQARMMSIYVDSKTKIISAIVNGKKIDNQISKSIKSSSPWGLTYFAFPKEGIELTLKTKSSGSLKLKAIEQSDGIPEIPNMNFKTRADYMMPMPFGISDSTFVSKSFTF